MAPLELSTEGLQELFAGLELLDRGQTTAGKRFLLRRLLDGPAGPLLERWLMWTFDPAYRYPWALPPLESFERQDAGIEWMMAWRVLERVLDDLRSGALPVAKAQRKLLYLLERAPAGMRRWIWRLLHQRLSPGVERETIDRLAPGLLP